MEYAECIHETLIPEFPLRVGTLYKNEELKEMKSKPSADQSYNVDYVAFSKEGETAYLVELKTDLESIRLEQQKYLACARTNEFSKLVEGVWKLAKASNKKRKYVHLLYRLSDSGLVRIPKELYKKSFPENNQARRGASPGWTKAIDQLLIERQKYSKTEVVFIQPTKDKSDRCDFEYIYFEEVAKVVQSRGDLGCMFANHLRQWTEPAGSPDPRNFDLHTL